MTDGHQGSSATTVKKVAGSDGERWETKGNTFEKWDYVRAGAGERGSKDLGLRTTAHPGFATLAN